MIRNLLSFSVISLLLIVFTSCESINGPVVERCGVLSWGLHCVKAQNGSSEVLEWDLSMKDARGYQCTSLQSYQVLADFYDGLASEVLECRSRSKELKRYREEYGLFEE